jgi:hypothetical protein
VLQQIAAVHGLGPWRPAARGDCARAVTADPRPVPAGAGSLWHFLCIERDAVAAHGAPARDGAEPMKFHVQKKLMLHRETLRNLSVRTGIKAGAPTALCTQQGTGC